MRAKSMSVRSRGLSLIYLLLLGFGMIFLPGCANSQPTATQNPPKASNSQEQNVNQNIAGILPATANVTVDELEAAVEANKGVQLIDIREPREFAAGHVKMAINRPLGGLEKEITQISKDKDIILIDLNGTRSESAWQLLVDKGYDKNKIKVLTGGMLSWNGIVSAAAGNNASGSASGGAEPPKAEVAEMVGGC